ncbi:hypothetical protein [Botryobacter ruber]|uniref:hypothetical protein n=1 Tax=Botryobacter ruber TaxID=2171629 RepID=UPI000F64DACE|nr:hypothetical protein [Botryobacter ruber]
MKTLIVSLFSFFLLLAVTDVKAQTAMDNSKSKDEFWGTPKKTHRGASADAVGTRGEALDTRYNAYETGKRGSFRLMNFKNKNIKLTEMQKREEKILKKHKREKKRREREMRRND